MNIQRYFASILILVASLFCVACENEQTKKIRPVAVYTLAESDKEFVVKFPSLVEAGNEAILSFKVAGPIVEFPHEVGAYVEKGQVLVRLDERDYGVQQKSSEEKMLAAKNAYLGAKAQADNARKQFARAEALYKENALAKKKFDEAKAMLEGAVAKEKASFASFQEARQGYINSGNQKADTMLIAPYNGYIKRKFVDVGTVVSAAMPVLSFSSDGRKKVQINISQSDMQYFSKNPQCFFVHKGREYALTLQTIGKVKQSFDLVYPVVFYIENDEDLLVGSEGTVYLHYINDNARALHVPVEAVFEKNGQSYVWIYRGNQVNLKPVQILRAEENGQIIVEGLVLGDIIVIKGVHDLYEGQEVRILEDFTPTNIGEVL